MRDERVVAAITRLSRAWLSDDVENSLDSASVSGMTASARKKTTESASRKHVAKNIGTYAHTL